MCESTEALLSILFDGCNATDRLEMLIYVNDWVIAAQKHLQASAALTPNADKLVGSVSSEEDF